MSNKSKDVSNLIVKLIEKQLTSSEFYDQLVKVSNSEPRLTIIKFLD